MAEERTDEDVVVDMVADMQRCKAPLTFVLRPTTAFMLVGLLQLALRHGGVREPSRSVATAFIKHVREYFADHHAATVVEIIDRGDGR